MDPVRILIVDDQIASRGLAAIWLKDGLRGRAQILEAGSLAELRAAVAEHGPDVVVLDQRLPDGDGLDGARELLAADPDATIILLTGMSDPVLDQAAEDAGVTDFLVKHEVDGPMLARAVRFALRRRSDRRALRRSEQRYRELVRALPDTSALVVDAGLRFVAAGGEALEGAGVDVQALVGRSVPEVLAELGYAEFLEDYEAALAGERRTVERTIGGRSYRTSFRPLFVDGDRVLEAIVITVDLTERLRIATDLERAQAIAKTGSWYWDAPAQELFWSPELRRIYGMAPDAPMPTFGEYLRTMIVTADDRAAILEVTRRAQERLEDAELEFTIRRPDGERRVLATRVRCVSGPDGELWRIEGISQDVTALRSAWGGRAPELGLAGP